MLSLHSLVKVILIGIAGMSVLTFFLWLKGPNTSTFYGGKLTKAKIKAIKMGTITPPATPKPSTHGKSSREEAEG